MNGLSLKQKVCVAGLRWQVTQPATAGRTPIPEVNSNGNNTQRY